MERNVFCNVINFTAKNLPTTRHPCDYVVSLAPYLGEPLFSVHSCFYFSTNPLDYIHAKLEESFSYPHQYPTAFVVKRYQLRNHRYKTPTCSLAPFITAIQTPQSDYFFNIPRKKDGLSASSHEQGSTWQTANSRL